MTFLGYFVKAVIYLFVYNVIFFNVFSNYKCYRTKFMGKFDLLQIFSEKKGKKSFSLPLLIKKKLIIFDNSFKMFFCAADLINGYLII